MNSDLFPRAKEVGLRHVMLWLPHGEQEGDEWKALNPTRTDKTPGSFKVNLKTGKWADFATGDKGGDAVSLYAYLNNIKQGEAARKILEEYDEDYFPSERDVFEPPPENKKKDYWSGFALLKRGMADPPPLKTEWHQEKYGREVERWPFHDKRGNVVMYAVRFQKNGEKKADRPFTLWKKGDTVKWRNKALDGDYPLWNLPEIIARPNDPVLLFEGQKAASRAKAKMAGYVCTGWYQGVNSFGKSDYSVLAGRTVYFWPDADQEGRSVIGRVKKLAEDIVFDLKIIPSPTGIKKGWDIADAIAEGMTAEAIEEIISKTNLPVKKTGVQYIDDLAQRYPLANGGLDDIQDAWRLVDYLGDNFRWCEVHGSWYYFDCGIWQKDNEQLRVVREVKRAVCEFLQEARARQDQNGFEHFRAINKNINRVMRLITSMKPEVAVLVDQLDARDTLLNCRNGTLNLDTFDFYPHDKAEYHTKQVRAHYDPKAAPPAEWLKFIDDIFLGEESLIRYAQKVMGYALSGGTGEQEFYIFWGDGNNGKSQLIKCFSLLTDSYSHNLSADKIMTSKYQGSNDTYMAQLKNIRALFCSETQKMRTLDTDLIKILTGGEPMTVAQKYEKPQTFEISAKVFLVTNHKPVIRDTSEGIWRRIRLIPFLYEVPKKDRIKDYGTRLYKAGPTGILNWFLDGYKLYRIDGLEAPDIVKTHDEEYRAEEDIMLQFLTERMADVPASRLPFNDVYDVFCEFTKDYNMHWSRKRLSKELKLKHYAMEHSRTGNVVVGLAWRDGRPGDLPLEETPF